MARWTDGDGCRLAGWSQRGLIVVAAVVVAGGIVVAAGVATREAPPEVRATRATSAVPPSAPAVVVPTAPVVPLSPPTSSGQVAGDDAVLAGPAAYDRAVAAAVVFLTAWGTPGTSEERAGRLAPLATPRLVGLLADVDADRLPSSVGAPAVVMVGTTAAVAVAPLSEGGAVRVSLELTGVGWVATQVGQP